MPPVGQHHRGLDDIVHVEIGQPENGLDVCEDLAGLGANVSRTNEPPMNVGTDLSCDKHQVTHSHPVRIRGSPRSKLIRIDDVLTPLQDRPTSLRNGRVDSQP
jgi:hypothetical protein